LNNLYVISGVNPTQMTINLLKYINPLSNKSKDIKIGIKPNLVCASPASEGATTHPEIVEGIIIYLQENGFSDIKIIEGSWVGDSTKRAYKACGFLPLTSKYNVPLVDLQEDEYVVKQYKDLEIKICKTVTEIDYLINVPLIKGHCQTKITCALKNLKGLIPDIEKRRFHTLGLHKPIAYLNRLIKQDLIISDAICPDPYFEEGGSPHGLNRIVAGYDPVLMDTYAAQVLGYRHEEVQYITLAEGEGVGSTLLNEAKIIDISSDKRNDVESELLGIKQKENKYLRLIEEADACSACYSNLVSALNQLNEIGLIEKFSEQICIGQSYRGYKGCIGIGDCTKDFNTYLAGCPPKAEDILAFLKGL